jgi:outer membrane protein assembly factor BamE (lipoprotein component of BamABCDE complex)
MKTLSISALFLGLLLAGCGTPGGLVAQKSTNVEVRAALGNPTDVRFDRNGDELWEYARGPGGYETHLVRIGSDGRIGEVTQILTQERLMSLAPGKSAKPEVRHVLGRPSEVSYPGTGEAWSWRFNLGGAQLGHLVVTFNPDNTVRERMVVMDAAGGDRDKGSK